jgi:hypothetical protein
MCLGVISFSFAVGTLSNALSHLDSLQAKLNSKYAMLDQIAEEYYLDHDYVIKLRQILKYHYSKNESDKYQFVDELPPKEQAALTHLINEEITTKFKFFQKLPQKIFPLFLSNIKHIKIMKGEYVYEEGEVANSMFFVVKGSAQLVRRFINKFLLGISKLSRNSFH